MVEDLRFGAWGLGFRVDELQPRNPARGDATTFGVTPID